VGALMEDLGTRLPGLAGGRLGGRAVAYADDFSYTDPVDGSVSEHQGLRIGFEDGSRIVFRLSGTGTSGATLRVYLEQFTDDPADYSRNAHDLLAPIAALAGEVARIEHYTGRGEPDVVT